MASAFEAIGLPVPAFNCDEGTLVPATNLTGVGTPDETCDAPNVLNHECDPGSKFQVLAQTEEAIVVAHCRKRGLPDGFYEDIAVIQYNQVNGATCFYQALGNLPAEVSAPSDVVSGGPLPAGCSVTPYGAGDTCDPPLGAQAVSAPSDSPEPLDPVTPVGLNP